MLIVLQVALDPVMAVAAAWARAVLALGAAAVAARWPLEVTVAAMLIIMAAPLANKQTNRH